MRFIVFFILCFGYLYANKDFKYSYVDMTGHQIPHSQKQLILDGYDHLNAIVTILKEGDVDEAYDRILELESANKIDILKSPIIILKSEIMLKKEARRFAIEGAIFLEKAINSSLVHEDDLPQAYMTLIDLLIKTNKIDEAQYFADMLAKSFDDPLINAYGKIYQSKIITNKRDFERSTRMLYEILTQTKDLEVATIVAHELFDVFILNGQNDKAYDLIQQVVNNNIEYYVDNSYEALQKVKKLQENDMPLFAAQILETIIKNTNNPFLLEEFKYRLAVAYMDMYTIGSDYLEKAKDIFEEVYTQFRDGKYSSDAKMNIDEILMRQKRIEPIVLSERYQDSFSMEQKVLLQELINLADIKDYENILKAKIVYDKIPQPIAKRFGYESIEALFDIITAQMIKDYLSKGACKELSEVINYASPQTLQVLIEDKLATKEFFECMIDYPSKIVFDIAKESFNTSRDGQIYLYLEQIALNLGMLEEAYNMSLKIEMVNSIEIFKKEFLYKFLILTQKNDQFLLQRYFQNAQKNNLLIEANMDNPIIIDFLYRYYFYLLDSDKVLANKILNQLYNKQKEFNARVYSPFVEMELAKGFVAKKDFNKALEFLDEGYNKSRFIRADLRVQLYYEKAKIYKQMNNSTFLKDFKDKCKNVENTTNQIYQQMCERL